MQSNLDQAVGIALTGTLVAFVALGAIAVLIALIGYLDQRATQRADQKAEPQTTPAHARSGGRDQLLIDDLTLVLITSAVTAVLQGRGRVRHIRRIHPANGDWAMQGRVTVQGSHVMTGHFTSRGKR